MSDTTTSSKPRPVSALEQALRDMADNLELYNEDETWADGMRVAADLVHDRDAELFALMDRAEEAKRMYDEAAMLQHAQICKVFINGMRAILEGKTS